MNMIACDGVWEIADNTFAISCSGTLQVVAGGGPFGLPPITYAEANELLTAIAFLLVSVFAFHQVRRILL